MDQQVMWIHYIPVLTTILSAIFCIYLFKKWRRNGGLQNIWWAFGVFTYGLGTFLEATIAISGNSVFLFKAWYVAGALFGGYPLAQGTVYLLLKKKTAHILSVLTVIFIIAASTLIIMSPVDTSIMLAHKPGGDVLVWQWVRLTTPIINLYAVIFLIGGALYSTVYFLKKKNYGKRALGTGLIAFGGILPGIGGSMAKAGIVEALFIGELLGIIFIWWGTVEAGRARRNN